MWVVRPARSGDHASLVELAQALGPGMTTLPSSRDAMAEKIESSSQSFSGELPPENAQYFLVLEDLESQRVLGTAGVYPHIGNPGGFFSFHIEKLVQYSAALGVSRTFDILHLSNAYSGLTEVGTLAVHPGLRKGGAGRLLARSRYLLIAKFPHLFAGQVIAEMRGWQDENSESPFWSAVGEHCFGYAFAHADALSATTGTAWIADLLPRYPIYIDFLPEAARQSIGKPHATSSIAMAMLMKEGFRYDRYVDVFDAGPQVVASTKDIKTIANSRTASLDDGSGGKGVHRDLLVASGALADFRVCRTSALAQAALLTLDPDHQRLLDVTAGEEVTVVPA